MALSDEEKLKRARRWIKPSIYIALSLGAITLYFVREPFTRWIVAYIVSFVSFCVINVINAAINSADYYPSDTEEHRKNHSGSDFKADTRFASNNIHTDIGYRGMTGNAFNHHDSSRY